MEPTLQAGDRVLCLPWWLYRVGHIVVARFEHGVSVKRIERMSGRGFWLVGDNRSRSTDSRELGWIPRSQLCGRVIYRYAPPDRERWLFSA